METSLWSCGHTCTDSGIPVACEMEEKEELKNLLMWMVNGRLRNFDIPKKLEIANFISQQKVQDFQSSNRTIHHGIHMKPFRVTH